MDSDRDKWNTRFASKEDVAPQAPEFFVENLAQLREGRVLDIASGDGAVALYLAKQGFTVTAIDISDVALERLQQFSVDQRTDIATKRVDLDDAKLLGMLPHFDNITISRYKPSLEQWPIIVPLLRPGGMLLISTFNARHHQENNFPLRFCLCTDELISVHPEMVMVHHASVIRGSSFMDDYVFKRRD